jgi:polar amino acid transport system ATP-binding protein
MKLEVKNLRKTFKNHVGLEQASFFIPECKTLAVIGPSGGGKSTLLRLIAGLDIPDSGTILIDDQPIIFEESFLLQHRRSLGIVFQSFNLFPHLTILQNIELPLHKVHGLSPEEASQRSLELLTRFGLQNHRHKKPYHLSGGQRQRAAIIRAVATKAKLLLLDEPTSALDPLMTSEVLDLIDELRREGGLMILVSHHLGFVKKTADWVVFLDAGQVLECAPVNEFFSSPQTDSAKRFLEKVLKY